MAVGAGQGSPAQQQAREGQRPEHGHVGLFCGVAAFLPLAKPGALCRTPAAELPTAGHFPARFFNSFFLFFRARTRGQAAKPLSMRVCGVFDASRIPSFSEFIPSFSEFVRLFPSPIHNPSSNLFDGIYAFRRKMFLTEKLGE